MGLASGPVDRMPKYAAVSTLVEAALKRCPSGKVPLIKAFSSAAFCPLSWQDTLAMHRKLAARTAHPAATFILNFFCCLSNTS